MQKELTNEEFVEALKSKTFENIVVVYGLVQEGDPGYILFSNDTQCNDWIDIPIECVEAAQFLRNYTCPNGGDAPVFKLSLNIPEKGKNKTVRSLVKLLKRTASKPFGVMTDFNWYCEKHAHCGDGTFQTGSYVSPVKGIAEAEAEQEARDSCRNRGGVLSVGGGYCEMI